MCKQIWTRCSLMVGALTAVCLTALPAAAAEEGAAQVGAGQHTGMVAVAVALGIGLAVLGGAFGQSRAAAAALEGIARNPNASDKVFVPMILGLSFIESLVLFAWVLMFILLNKV